jgi:hypothetical protein
MLARYFKDVQVLFISRSWFLGLGPARKFRALAIYPCGVCDKAVLVRQVAASESIIYGSTLMFKP